MTSPPPYRYDLFISSAGADDQPLPGESKGWVTTLVDYLQMLLAKKLGRKESLALWTDRQPAGAALRMPEISDTFPNSAAIVVILSPNYLASEWCRRESLPFLRWLREAGSRVFLVERDRVEERPPELSDLPGYRFWEEEPEGRGTRILGVPRPDPDKEPRYHQLVYRLSTDLAETIQRCGVSPPSSGSPADPDGRVMVFLAEVTDDLDTERDEVKSYLTQEGLRVLPEVWYPRDPAAFQGRAQADLARSKVFVQLLSGVAGKRVPELPQGYVGLQHALARERNLPLLQWRSRELDPTRVANLDHRALLQGETVAAEGLEEFKRRVVRIATAPPPPSPKAPNPSGTEYRVFVNAEETDLPLMENLQRELGARRIGCYLPLQSDNPDEVRKDLETNLRECDALMLIYGRTRPTWLRQQLGQSRKSLSNREDPLKVIGIYEGPPEPKVPLRVKLPKLRFINCRQGLNGEELQRFLDELAASPNQVTPEREAPRPLAARVGNQVFISYSHSDKKWLERLQKMLKPLVRSGAISLWDDTRIQPGAEWRKEIEKALASAKVAVLLVSSSFLDSDFIAEQGLPSLLKAAAGEGVTILWVLVSRCLFQVTEIATYQAAHNPAQPLEALRTGDLVNKALVAICERIMDAVESP